MRRDDQDRLAAEFKRDADNDNLWEEMPAPVQRPISALGAQVTIRLEPAMAERLREVARRTGGLYTRMLREWIEERLVRETTLTVPQPPDIQVAGEGGTPPVQVTGAGRLAT